MVRLGRFGESINNNADSRDHLGGVEAMARAEANDRANDKDSQQ